VTLSRLVKLAVPNYFETLGMWIGNFLVLLMVGWMGSGLLGAHIIAIRLEAISFLPGFAIGTAAATLAGQYLGARREDLARRAVWRCAILAAGLMAGFGIAFITIPTVLVGLMSSQPEHLEYTPTPLFIAGLVQIPFAIGIVFRGAMRGAGDVKFVMGLTWTSTYAVRLPLAFLLSGTDIVVNRVVDGETVRRVLLENPMPDDFVLRGLTGLWAALCIDLTVRCCVFSARFLHGGWARKRV
jgi:Na+-driven multidrug efflux pump